MKHFRLTVSVLLVVMMLSGCAKEYYERLDVLKEKVTQLEAMCDTYNGNLLAIQTLARLMDAKDMISGITSIKEDGKEVGYKINFVEHGPVAIYNGISGNIPIIGTKRDSDGYTYWTIKYGDGAVDWLRDNNGNKVLSASQVPFVTIRDGRWMMTLDGVKYTDLGQADGENGDAFIKSFEITNSDIVTLTLIDGSVYQFPRFEAYTTVSEDIRKASSNVSAQAKILNAIKTKYVYVKSVSEILSESGEKIGTHVELSNGDKCDIYDALGSNIPTIFAKTDPKDGILYWAISFNDADSEWIYTEDGNRLPASYPDSKAPMIDMAKDAEDGFYYWTIKYGDEAAKFITDDKGARPHAIDSVRYSVFSSIDLSNEDYVTFVGTDGTLYSVPRYFCITVDQSVTMAPGAKAYLDYTVFGDEKGETKLEFITQSGFIIKDIGAKRLEITAPADFETGTHVLIVFTLGTRTVVKPIKITKGA
jgi:hypothetical protein